MSSSHPHGAAHDEVGGSTNSHPPDQPLFDSAPPGNRQPHEHGQYAGHPHMEQVLNATAKHVFPEQPSPDESKTGGSKDVTKEGLPHVAKRSSDPSRQARHARRRQDKIRNGEDDDSDIEEQDDAEERDPDQKPLMHGTPLDELKTPMFERSRGVLDMKPATSPGVIEPGMSKLAVHDEHDEHDETSPSAKDVPNVPAPRQAGMQQETQPERPPMRGMGSVRMGTSALVSALNALPWEGDEEMSDSSDEEGPSQGGPEQARRPQGEFHACLLMLQ